VVAAAPPKLFGNPHYHRPSVPDPSKIRNPKSSNIAILTGEAFANVYLSFKLKIVNVDPDKKRFKDFLFLGAGCVHSAFGWHFYSAKITILISII
jgi:hypothetical protein